MSSVRVQPGRHPGESRDPGPNHGTRTTNHEADAVRVQPVILCGGSGTRLWPLSRAGFPKQFLALNGNETLFQQAVRGTLAPPVSLCGRISIAKLPTGN